MGSYWFYPSKELQSSLQSWPIAVRGVTSALRQCERSFCRSVPSGAMQAAPIVHLTSAIAPAHVCSPGPRPPFMVTKELTSIILVTSWA